MKIDKKSKLEELKKGDAIAIVYGFEYLKAVVIGNNGSHITWYSESWLKSSAKVSTYDELESMSWTHIGKWKFRFIMPKKLKLIISK